MNDSTQVHRDLRLAIAVALAGAFLIGACASTPPVPTASLLAARSAIADAEKADAGRYAGSELGEAREKLVAANNAVEQKRMTGAERLADESRVEANLASAKTAGAKAAAVNDEMKHSNDTLVEEMQRKSGDQP